MTQGSNRLFDDFAKLASDATSVAQSVRREIETAVRVQAERFLADMDLVQRDEHEAVKEMAASAADEVDQLKTRIAALEARVASLEAASGPQEPPPVDFSGSSNPLA